MTIDNSTKPYRAATRTTTASIVAILLVAGLASSLASQGVRGTGGIDGNASNVTPTNDVQWVQVLVDPKSREVFAYQAQIVPGNRVAVPAPSRHAQSTSLGATPAAICPASVFAGVA